MSKYIGTGAALVSPPGSRASRKGRWKRPDPGAQDGCVGTAGPPQTLGRNWAAHVMAGWAEDPASGL